MTSITQLLSPWPATKSESIVLRDHPEYPPPPNHTPLTMSTSIYQSEVDAMISPQAQNSALSPSGGSPPNTSEHSDGEGNQADGRKGYGKRELSTSKRAAQNRAAQRAFRQRKEGYIKKLEEQVRDYQVLSENFKAVQSENYQLRDYIINLQSRLLESQHEVPPPPSNVDGLQPGKAHLSLNTPHQHVAIAAQQPNLSPNSQTLPRIAEMDTARITPPHEQQLNSQNATRSPSNNSQQYGFEEQAIKRPKRSPSMTPAQSALQGTAVLAQNAVPR